VFPLVVLEQVVLAEVDVVNTSTTFLLFEITLQQWSVWVVLVVLLPVQHGLRNGGLASNATQRLSNVDPTEQITEAAVGLTRCVGASLELLGIACGDQTVANRVAHSHNTLHCVARQLKDLDLTRLEHALEVLLGLWVELVRAHKIDLVDDDGDELIREQRLDVVEESDLRGD
jgi:hypothetical protein